MASTALVATGPQFTEEFWEIAGKLTQGDFSSVTPEERLSYVRFVCGALHLNPTNSPLRWIKTQNGTIPYLTKDATDQLRTMHHVSLTIVSREYVGDAFLVTARAQMPDGRTDESTGAVWLKGKVGDDLPNALMKAETKAKRRVTLSICGLGFLDESETETIRGARPVAVDEDGVIYEQATPALVRASVTPIREEPPADDWDAEPPPPARYARSAPPQRARTTTGMGAGFKTPQLIEKMNADYGYTIADGTPLWQVIAQVEDRYGEEVPSEGVDDAGKLKRYPATVWNHVKAQEAELAAAQ